MRAFLFLSCLSTFVAAQTLTSLTQDSAVVVSPRDFIFNDFTLLPP